MLLSVLGNCFFLSYHCTPVNTLINVNPLIMTVETGAKLNAEFFFT